MNRFRLFDTFVSCDTRNLAKPSGRYHLPTRTREESSQILKFFEAVRRRGLLGKVWRMPRTFPGGVQDIVQHW